jgi:purine-binding chemotaxis protein CheW
MSLQTATHAGAPVAPDVASAGTAITPIREFLAFKLGAEGYGIDILRVQEIRSYEEPTRIANAPAFIKGVRGDLPSARSNRPWPRPRRR